MSELTVDFLISPTGEEEEGGSIKNLEGDLAAIVIPGLELAFDDLRRAELSGTRLSGAEATQEVPVCGPGAFVLLKALACDRRGKDKDKYDLFYVIRNYRDGPSAVAESFRNTYQSAGQVYSNDFPISHERMKPTGFDPLPEYTNINNRC